MLNQIVSIVVATVIFASCERSNRTIEVQPNTNTVKPTTAPTDGKVPSHPDGTPDTSGATGSVDLIFKGGSSSASKLEIDWSFNGSSGHKSAALVSGSATITVSDLAVGSGLLQVSGTLDGTNIKAVSSNITIVKGSPVQATFTISGGSIIPGPVTPGPVTPGPVTPGPVTPGPVTPGDSDVVIVPEIGPSTTPPGPTLEWDGKSFKGNAKWSLEPIP